MIEILNKTNPGFYEMCKVLDHKDKRDYVKYIHVNGEHCHGTNSKIIIRCTTPSELSDGFYTVVRLTKKTAVLVKVDDITYPDVARVLDLENTFELPLPLCFNIGEIQYHLAKEADTAVDPNYLAPVARNIDDLRTVKVKPGGNTIQFDFRGGWVAGVMPLNLK